MAAIVHKTPFACEIHDVTLTAGGPCKESELLPRAGSGSGAAQGESWGVPGDHAENGNEGGRGLGIIPVRDNCRTSNLKPEGRKLM